MKTVFPNREVPHIWAQQNQPKARNSTETIYFEGDKIYSYGRHFCMGRILPSGIAVLTTRTYGMATSKHLTYTRQAVNHKHCVYCNDPSESAASNRRVARQEVADYLAEAETTRRVLQRTREASLASALGVANRFNDYLRALPEEEREGTAEIDTSDLQAFAGELVAQELARKAREAEIIKQRNVPAAERLAKWRELDPAVRTEGFRNLPVALRLKHTTQPGEVVATEKTISVGVPTTRSVIETSHGASVPVEVAARVWGWVQGVRAEKSGATFVGTAAERRLGNYMLDRVEADGTLKVGCHTIPYSELELMAKALKFI